MEHLQLNIAAITSLKWNDFITVAFNELLPKMAQLNMEHFFMF